MNLFEMSISGGLLILFIILVRVFAINHLPKTTFLVLWIIAAFRLLLPVSIPVTLKVNNNLNAFSKISEKVSSSYTVGYTAQNSSSKDISIFLIIWLIGALLFLAYFTVSYLKCIKKFRMSIPDNTPFIKSWLKSHKIIRSIDVRSSDLICSPLTYGLFRPVILLPKKLDRNNTELEYIITHEYIHIKRFDAVTKILFALVLCIYWFNPLVWVMYILANRDIELSCDSCVIRMLGEKNRSSYALMLIGMEETKNGIYTLCNNFSQNAITERIEAIMKFKKTSILACSLSLVLVASAMTAFAAFTDNTDEYNDISPITGVAYTESDLVSIHLNESNNNTDNEISIADNGETSNSSITINIEDAQSEDLSNSDTEIISGETTLISVSHDDESKFTPEEWEKILEQIDQGLVYWED